jgi:hypothetical protein
MNENFSHKRCVPPPLRILPILEKTKSAYLIWFEYFKILTKAHRYTLGRKIDSIFIEIIEALAFAGFLQKKEKLPYIRLAIRKLDVLKILLMVLWETESLDSGKYIALSLKIEEIGRMAGGWQGQVLKQNSPKSGEK